MKRNNKLGGLLSGVRAGSKGITTRVYLLAAGMAGIVIFLGSTGIFSLKGQRNHVIAVEDSSREWTEAIQSVSTAQGYFQTQITEWNNTLLRGDEKKDYDKHWVAFQRFETQFRTELQKASEQLQNLGMSTSMVSEILTYHKDMGEKYRAGLANHFTDGQGVNAARATDSAVRGMDRSVGASLSEFMSQCQKAQTDAAVMLHNSAEGDFESARTMGFIWLVVGFLFAVGMAVYLVVAVRSVLGKLEETLQESTSTRERVEEENRSLQTNIVDLLEVVSNAADGDLSVRAKVDTGSLGNVADALNQMLDNWGELLRDIRSTTERTRTASFEIGEASAKMADGASHQVLAISDASDSVTHMTESIRRVTANAQNAVSAASRTKTSAEQGSESVQAVVRGMDTLRSNVQAGAKKIKNLGDRSMEITGIVGTIAKISEQTNMLALNAAIEAARAGEHGRGFSVVAEEVRKLAERTASATHEIETLITGIQAETSESVEAIESQTQVVEEESLAVAQAGEVLMRIQGDSTHSAEIVTEITSTAQAQVDTATGTVKKMEEVSSIARQTQLGANTALALTKSLDEVVGQLQESISRFKLD